MHPFRSTAALAALLSGLTLASAQAAEPTGTWLTQKRDAHVRIAHCGKALCGTIVWIKDKIDPKTGKPPVDVDNPNPRLRHRRIVGLRIFAMTPGRQRPLDRPDLQCRQRPHLRRQAQAAAATARSKCDGCFGLICGSETWHRIGR